MPPGDLVIAALSSIRSSARSGSLQVRNAGFYTLDLDCLGGMVHHALGGAYADRSRRVFSSMTFSSVVAGWRSYDNNAVQVYGLLPAPRVP